MSIYPVKLSEWYPYGDEHHGVLISIIACTRCYACGDRVRFKRAVGMHSIPFGHGDLYCSEKCLDSGKIAKVDKRRLRRFKRKYGHLEGLMVDLGYEKK